MSPAARKRKPTIAVRVANRLARLAPAEVKALLEATERLRKESGDGLREAMQEQREALARLAELTGQAAEEEGVKATLALQRRVQNTVRAAAVSAPAALRDGALEEELQPGGFDTLAGLPAPARTARKSETQERQQAAAEREKRARFARELRAAEQAARRNEARATQLAAAAEKAERSAADARARAEEARHAADEAAARALALRRLNCR